MSKPVRILRDGLLEKRASFKLIKSQWGLIVGINATVGQLKNALQSIPNDAKIIDQEEYESGDSFPYVNSVKDGSVYIFEVIEEDKIDE